MPLKYTSLFESLKNLFKKKKKRFISSKDSFIIIGDNNKIKW